MAASATSAVDKALDLVEAVTRSPHPPRLSELADGLGLHRATAYRVLVDLGRRGWVLRLGDRYLPGPVLLQLTAGAAARSLAALARPVLEDLSARTGLMVNLQVPAGDRSRVVDVVRPDRLAMLSDLRDELLPLHRFAGPLALVAALGEAEREPFLRAAEAQGHPLDGPGGLRAELARTARTGHAVQRERAQQLVASASRALTAPGGAPVCALTLVGPSAEFADPRLAGLLRELDRGAEELRRVLGAIGGTP
ncbi:helix-turn-helix domain-containing protein [Streptomyces sp. NPDC051940]|uniref:IclR family transcriptional regulator n=1 Tax=Streptomyces sp. NPDC051940 TaxID=3155675 RepID=UPI003445F6C2